MNTDATVYITLGENAWESESGDRTGVVVLIKNTVATITLKVSSLDDMEALVNSWKELLKPNSSRSQLLSSYVSDYALVFSSAQEIITFLSGPNWMKSNAINVFKNLSKSLLEKVQPTD